MSASTDSQALTRTFRSPQNLSKTTRLNVPQFLQKLYEMVNDANNNDLIRWSDSGDSFLVLDHERFAREVLGRWFKHQNFQSFVRQLNMYGFHKIPSLQQGVLRSDSDTEIWNFEHPQFRQGQPDLLCLISRKKQASQQPPAIEDTISSDPQDPSSPTTGAVLDLNSIINGIQAIKRHQQTISADLSELKSSNQSLWQEALAARERHNKQQDMINRILRFLASVFGRRDNEDPKTHHHHDHVSPSPPLVRTQRLLIGGPDRPKKSVEVHEVADDDDEQRSHSPTTSNRSDDGVPTFAYVDPPSLTTSASTPPHFTPLATASTAPDSYFDPSSSPWFNAANALPSSHPPSSFTDAAPTPASETPANTQLELHRPQSTPPNNPFLPPLDGPYQAPGSQDAILSAAFQHLMHSPAQMQRFLEAIAQGTPSALDAAPHAVQSYTPPPPPAPPAPPFAPAPSFDYGHAFTPEFAAALLPRSEEPAPPAALLDNTDHLSRAYRSKHEIDADVDLMHQNISRLIENMGLDATLLNQDPLPTPDPASAPTPASTAPPPADPDPAPDFDFDAFLSSWPPAPAHTDGEPVGTPAAGDEDVTAFMDDVAADAGKAQAAQAQVQAAKSARKRRSDAAGFDLPPPTQTPSALSASTPPAKKARAVS